MRTPVRTAEYEYWSPNTFGYSRPEERRTGHKMLTKRYSGVSLFCESTSIRGMAKIAKSQTRFLKMLWLLFIVFMTGGLFASATLLVLDFLSYDIGVHTSNIEMPSEFPAITICHHHPFSKNAYRLWDQKRVMSPSMYNQRLRALGKAALERNNVNEALLTHSYDSVEIYYQNLEYSQVVQLGHNYTSYQNCMILQNAMLSYEADCLKLPEIKMKRLSHSKYFNCYTFEPKDKVTAESIQTFAVVVSMGPPPNYTHFEQAFLMDIFEQARGLRIVVHERGSLPDMEQDGIQVEPGKYTEISYQPVNWKKLNTPRKPCENSNRTFKDLGREYNYDARQCEGYYNQQLYNHHCRCIYAMYIRPNMPSHQLPYCGNMKTMKRLDYMFERISCLTKWMNKRIKRNKEPDERGALCLPRCDFFEFQNQISITEWRVTDWQLNWMRYEYRLLMYMEKMQAESNFTLNVSNTQEFRDIMKYFDAKNLTEFQPRSDNNFIFNNKNFAYVRLKRKSQSSLIKREKLILSLNVLMSRVGGLCSLSIGLTTAFVVELIEFLYLYCRAQSGYLPESNNSKPNTSEGQFMDKSEDVHEFSMFEPNRPHLDYYGSKNGRFPPNPNRNRMFRADYSAPVSTTKLKLRKEPASYVG